MATVDPYDLLEQYVSRVGVVGLRTMQPAYFYGGINNDQKLTVTPTGSASSDVTAIQNAINTLSTAGGGEVWLQGKEYFVNSNIKLKNNVHIRGNGMFQTKLTATATLGSSAVLGDTSNVIGSQLVNVIVSDLEIDGSAMPTSPYAIGRKGIEGNYLQLCMFQNLYIHNTPASGLGIDNLDRVWIDHCYIKNCGTAGQSQGSNGVGIGTGGNTNESFIVTNCITENIANSAYLTEDLELVTTTEKMYIFSNNISINDYTGFSISGCDNVSVIGNQIYSPTNNGIRCIKFVSHNPDNILIKGNSVIEATSYGILIENDSTNFSIEGNTVRDGTVEGIYCRGFKGNIVNNIVRDNGKHGIMIFGAASQPNITDLNITNNFVFNNSKITANSDGIRLDGSNISFSDIRITGNRCYDDQGTPTQRYGIILSSGTGHSNIDISNNNVRGNKTGGFLKSNFTMASVANLTIRNNMGANPDCYYSQGSVTGATTFNRANGSHVAATLTGNITVTLTAGINEGDELTLELIQDGTGSRTVTWPANFKKAGGTLTLSTGVAAVDLIKARYDGTNWVEVARALNVS